MKTNKISFLIVLLAFISNSAKAQLSVYSNGNVGIATSNSSIPESTFSVKGGMTGFEASIKGDERGIYVDSNGQYLNWSYGIYGKSNCSSASFQNGVSGVACINSPQSSCRTYGVIGLAGNATNGWNYGVFGQLNGTNNGAGIYGTSTSGENGSCVDARYAGYFNGATKVNGDFIVTGTINGVVLNQVSNASNISLLSSNIEESSLKDKLSNLSTTCYYTDDNTEEANSSENVSDTTNVTPVNVESPCYSASRLHYGLDIDQLKENFPELVYEHSDGTIGVNYMEMIPILIETINILNSEIKALKANISNLSSVSSASNSNSTSVLISTDGKVLGTKTSLSK